MHRLAISILGGFILIYLQSLLVMKLNGYAALKFTSLSAVFSLWCVNFFFIYSLLIQLKKFYRKRVEKLDV